jgi:hypothetical protein
VLVVLAPALLRKKMPGGTADHTRRMPRCGKAKAELAIARDL